MAQSYSRVPEGVDILLNIAIVISTIVVLCLSWNEHPAYTVRFWIWGVALLSVGQLIVAVILCNAPDNERAIYWKVCTFTLCFVLMIVGYQLLVDETFKKKAPRHYWFVILLIVVRMCYFSFYCCLVPTLYNCRRKGGPNDNQQPLLGDDNSGMPILRRDYFTCFQHDGQKHMIVPNGGPKCMIEEHGGPSNAQPRDKIIV
ncbi:hypothetical protein ACHQM5_026886 [Ranunculus cassubicifolius]